ncbi:glycosyltransferase [Polaribacter vadi]|nr:glycosyltransferase [Polaribacter vadi]
MKNYDLLIVHGLWQYQSFVVAQIAKSKDIPYYVMPHGMLDPYFQIAKERKLKAIRNRIFWQFIEKKLINNAKGLLFTCEEEKKLANTTFPMYNPKSEKVVGLGVELPPIETNKMREELQLIVPEWNGKPFWLFLSRIHPKKGVDLLIEAYTKLEQENIDLPQLIIAGPGLITEYGKKVLEKSKSSKNIYFPGMLTGDARWGAFYAAECFILPSHQENFGIAVVEALACGTPVLISNKVNIWREIEKNKAGIVQNDDTGSIFKSLKTWFNYSNELKKYYEQNAKGVFLKYFEIHQVGKRFVKELI